MDLFGLKDKVAIVTGAGNGMGREIALTLARTGANLVISDIDERNGNQVKEEIEKLDRKALFIKTDITNKESVDAMIEETVQHFGKIDILVNNAGVSRSVPFVEIEEAEWDRVFNVNVKGVYLCSKAVIPHMIEQKSGKIVNMSSFVGKSAIPNFVHYSASKFAVIGITQGLAKELAEHNINVNSVCPGVVRTALWDELLEQMSDGSAASKEEVFGEFVDDIPLKRPQEPQDVANMIAYLSSDLAKNITGQSINVCGGMG